MPGGSPLWQAPPDLVLRISTTLMIYSFAEGSHAFTRWEVLKSEIINVVEI